MGLSRIAVRKATNPDIASINEIMQLSKAHWGYDEAFMDAFMQKFSINENYLANQNVHIIFKDKDIIGFFSFIFHDNDSLELDHFFLHPNYIGKGLGKRLWKECCIVASGLGAKEFILWSDPQAEGFYAKMGCKKIGVKKSPFMPNRYPSIMRYELPKQ